MMHVIVAEGRHDAAFIADHALGFDALAAHVRAHSPAWGEAVTGIPAERIAALARRYAATRPAMIVLGGSSMHKGANGWQAARAIACLPALTGNLGIPGGGFGPRHGSRSHGQDLTDITAPERRPPGAYIPNQMSRVTEALVDGRAARAAALRHGHALVLRRRRPGRGRASRGRTWSSATTSS